MSTKAERESLMPEVEMMEDLFLVGIERILMEVRTEMNLNKVFSSTHKEFKVLTDVWAKMMQIKMRYKLPSMARGGKEGRVKEIIEKMDRLRADMQAKRGPSK